MRPGADEFTPFGIPKTNFAEDNTVFLAFAYGSLQNEISESWLHYGWIEFGYDGTDVYIVDWAADETGLGIFVGGSTIPEPSTALLALAGLGLLFRRRRVVM